MKAMEFWVVRVLMHANGSAMRLGDNTSDVPGTVLAKVNTGDLACIPPHYDIAEPVDGPYSTEAAAVAEREVWCRREPGRDFRVILNTEALW